MLRGVKIVIYSVIIGNWSLVPVDRLYRTVILGRVVTYQDTGKITKALMVLC
jgi:hypothetical protein